MKESKPLLLSKGYTIREEAFGGLLFEQSSGKIKEINRTGVIILSELFKKNDPCLNIENLFQSQSGKKIKADTESFINSLHEAGILSTAGGGRFIPIKSDNCDLYLNAPRSVFWECTARCNIGTCIHCYSSSNQSRHPDPVGENLIQQLGEMGVFTIDIGGGEPLLRPDLPDLINLSNFYGMRSNVATNLSLEKSNILNVVGSVKNWQHNAIQISLDGFNSETHDAIRGGKGWFNRMVKNTKILIENGIKFHFNCTIMGHNLSSLEKIVKTSVRLGAHAVRFVRVIPSGRACDSELLLNAERYRSLCLKLRKIRARYKGIIDVKTDDSFLFLELSEEELTSLKPRIPWLRPPFVGCGAARTLLTITAKNRVLPCAYLRDSVFVAGSTTDLPIQDIWRFSPLLWQMRNQKSLGQPCDNCELKTICLGGCRAAAYGVYNTINAPDPGCWKK